MVVCPVECFHEDERMLYIDPEECIHCGACVPECPVEAIFYIDDVPEEMVDFVSLNAVKSQTCHQQKRDQQIREMPLLL